MNYVMPVLEVTFPQRSLGRMRHGACPHIRDLLLDSFVRGRVVLWLLIGPLMHWIYLDLEGRGMLDD